jgi:hypothetical protein
MQESTGLHSDNGAYNLEVHVRPESDYGLKYSKGLHVRMAQGCHC